MIDPTIALLGHGHHLLLRRRRRGVPRHATTVSMGKRGGAFLSIRR
jgi:hypothetical protein